MRNKLFTFIVIFLITLLVLTVGEKTLISLFTGLYEGVLYIINNFGTRFKYIALFILHNPLRIILALIISIVIFFYFSKDIHQQIKYKNRYIASLLAILLGTLGLHRFYLKRYISGIVYILGTLFISFYLTLIISVIEGVFLLLMPEVQFQETYKTKADTLD